MRYLCQRVYPARHGPGAALMRGPSAAAPGTLNILAPQGGYAAAGAWRGGNGWGGCPSHDRPAGGRPGWAGIRAVAGPGAQRQEKLPGSGHPG
jgi:hypothetical protein